jgi:hypothetical protein
MVQEPRKIDFPRPPRRRIGSLAWKGAREVPGPLPSFQNTDGNEAAIRFRDREWRHASLTREGTDRWKPGSCAKHLPMNALHDPLDALVNAALLRSLLKSRNAFRHINCPSIVLVFIAATVQGLIAPPELSLFT